MGSLFGILVLFILTLRLNLQTIYTDNSTIEFRHTTETTNPLFPVVTVNRKIENVTNISYSRLINLVIITYEGGYFISKKEEIHNLDIINLWD